MEQNEIYDKLMDGINAVKNSVMHGILPGGGVAYVHASKLLDYVKYDCLEEKIGLDILRETLREPFVSILENKGLSGKYYLNKILELNDWKMGYDVKNDKITNMIDAGVI